MSSRRVWIVVRGPYSDGVVVRKGRRYSALYPEHLSLGAYVEELEFAADTGSLYYQKLSGCGPAFGWVSTKLQDEDYLLPVEDDLWEVVGCAGQYGLAVHEEMNLSSARMMDRLSVGAIVKELEFFRGASRLRYQRLTGTGPEVGWISTSLPPKDLLVMEEAEWGLTDEIIWKVVGGGNAGGILVRQEQSTSSPQEDERLSTGCLVREVEFVTESFRLHFEKVGGEGPASGWVSTRVLGQELVLRLKTRLARFGFGPLQLRPGTSPELGQRTLRWCTKVGHLAVKQLHSLVTLSLGGAHGSTSTPVCTVETWAEDSDKEELAGCRGQVHCSSAAEAQVLWLGRSSARAVHERVKGWRCVRCCGSSAGGGAGEWLVAGDSTVAEAMMGVTAGVLNLFGAARLKLQVMDNGTGRLRRFYREAGFLESADEVNGEKVFMEASAREVAQLAPAVWLAGLVPAEFEAPGWLRREVPRLWLERARLGRLPEWDWAEPKPPAARMTTRMRRCDGVGEHSGCVLIDAFVFGSDGEELACGQGAVRLKQQLLSVLWLGRSGARDIHEAVRGRPLYRPCCSWKEDGATDLESTCQGPSSVTLGFALLGFLAALACLFGVDTSELQLPPASEVETESEVGEQAGGRFAARLRALGFEAAPLGQLRMGCEALALRCCPREWCSNLLRAEDLNSAAMEYDDLEEAGEDTLERDVPVCAIPEWLLRMA